MTADDTEVVVPHSKIWSSRVSNATSGRRSLLCVAEFYLHPDHDAAAAQRRLTEVAVGSSYRKADTPVTVIVQEKPWGTHYRLKAYVKESREQFGFITDLTIRGKEALRAMGIRFCASALRRDEAQLSRAEHVSASGSGPPRRHLRHLP